RNTTLKTATTSPRSAVSSLMPQTAEIDRTTSAPSDSTRIAPPRDLYIHRLRTIMTAFVILPHTPSTHGASGSWFYNELHVTGETSSILLTLFCATNQ